MSDQLAGLIISLVVGILMFTIALLIRIRGPVGLLKNIEWDRVSDPHGLGQFASVILALLGVAIVTHGIFLFALHGDTSARNWVTIAFVVVISILTIVLLLGQLRYQDKPPSRKRNERR